MSHTESRRALLDSVATMHGCGRCVHLDRTAPMNFLNSTGATCLEIAKSATLVTNLCKGRGAVWQKLGITTLPRTTLSPHCLLCIAASSHLSVPKHWHPQHDDHDCLEQANEPRFQAHPQGNNGKRRRYCVYNRQFRNFSGPTDICQLKGFLRIAESGFLTAWGVGTSRR